MNYSGYIFGDLVNGEGARCSLFVSGCSQGCEGCFNKETWNYNYGQPFTKDFQDNLLKDLKKPFINGLSILGGNPLEKKNFDTVLKLCYSVKQEMPEKTIWLWCGQTMQEIKNNLLYAQILDTVDVIIDGKFVKDLPTKKPFRGSDNQVLWRKVNGEFRNMG